MGENLNELNDLQMVQYLDKYARWDDKEKRRETWEETVTRVINFLKSHINTNFHDKLNKFPWHELESAMLKMEVLPSMRIVQMAGPALERCHVGAYNCAYLALKSPEDIADLLYILMQGTGVGFSVENYYIKKWRTVRKRNTSEAIKCIIDDTTEGWCDAVKLGLSTWIGGGDVEFDYSKIRPFGARLATKGGRASGPEPFSFHQITSPTSCGDKINFIRYPRYRMFLRPNRPSWWCSTRCNYFVK
jgi:ribonucleoside-diphosphate reductase alpha chain